ncbi:DUF1553 domain-containing protein [Lignipirellula cremea]|uniref:DUF1553 domain-containing protein n=1 Tax=Lignipirellula cremea TaxID=2528010 RepID=UPI0018D2424B|nr:DUF1553 domain-containing protein [Lignipirellula cremea]
MSLTLRIFLASLTVILGTTVSQATELDRVLEQENRDKGVDLEAMPVIDDMTFLRRVYVDLIGRIPTGTEIRDFMNMPEAGRREQLVDKLLEDPRFADRLTAFFGDMLRLRSNTPGGSALIAYVHQAMEEKMPYDELCRRLISTNGKANLTPEVGFILGDDADPLAMAAVTSQVFMGVRMSCAQCHDHPFDVWTRKEFYELAAYFGKTRRVESQITKAIYTTEQPTNTILWPPEDSAARADRKPLEPSFPIALLSESKEFNFIARLNEFRAKQEEARLAEQAAAAKEVSVDALLAETEEKAVLATRGGLSGLGIESEAKSEIRQIDIRGSLYGNSELRMELAKLVTSPRNRYFSRAITNRMWKEFIGRGFVEDIDDFREDNPPSHPQTMDFIADEFVASNYDLYGMARMIVLSDAYQRAHAPGNAEFAVREELESNFLSTPMRRMVSEAMYDSIVAAGHLFDVKHPEGANIKTVTETVRVAQAITEGEGEVANLTGNTGGAEMAMAGQPSPMMVVSGYALEEAIELDFDKLLKPQEEVSVEKMEVMSAEELEAQRMEREQPRPGMRYTTKTVSRQFDDNPQYGSAYRMVSPAPAGHFLRVFGQPGRADLGDLREDTASMRQALMMLNGRLSHEASRVGPMEPIYPLLVGKKANLTNAIRMAYYEILTREPTAGEVADAQVIIGEEDPVEGMADLRWVLLNSNEFRFLP